MDAGQEFHYGGYTIRVKSEKVRAENPGGWKPLAEVWMDSPESTPPTPIEPAKIRLVSTKEEADDIALRAARKWVEKRELFGEHLSEAVRILREWVKRG
jgi:hypothetical protein